jgi:hypothetical protein
MYLRLLLAVIGWLVTAGIIIIVIALGLVYAYKLRVY